MELSSRKIKKVLIFSLKELLLYFGKQNFLTFYILGGNFPSSNNEKITLKNFLYFRKWSFLARKLKKFFGISGRNLQSLKIKNF